MEVLYASPKVEKICTSVQEAKKAFGGNTTYALSLMSRINALKQAPTLRDIIVQRHFRFRNLESKKGRNLKGLYAIDVKTKHDKWRLILEPLDDNKEPFTNQRVDQIASTVRVVMVEEVSKHYEK